MVLFLSNLKKGIYESNPRRNPRNCTRRYRADGISSYNINLVSDPDRFVFRLFSVGGA